MDSDTNPKEERRAVFQLVLTIFGLIVISSFLLAINTGMVFGLTQGINQLLPERVGVSQLIQFSIYIGPVALLCLEWYLWDLITTRKLR